MDVHSLPRRRINCVAEEERSGSFTLIWLDENCEEDNIDTLQTKLLLKTLSPTCLFYKHIHKFREYLENRHLFVVESLLITSGAYTETLLNESRDKLSPWIIFCENYDKYKQHLRSSYIIDICTDYNSLKESIERFGLSLYTKLHENRRYNTILSLRTPWYDNTDILYSYILFIEILKQGSNMDEAKDSMVKQLKNYFRHDHIETKYIESFEETYKSKDAIEWYTREIFLYRLINRAFRTEDSALWYTFRFYIRDLCKQIEKVHREQNMKERFTVYRGQTQVPKAEFENIFSNCGGLVSCNGYFSTSTSLDVAKFFLGGARDTEDFHVVIFKITVNANELKHTIFVDINKCLQEDRNENEILFNIGTVFRIDGYQKEEDFWVIQLDATDVCIDDIKQRIKPTLSKLSTININIFLGKLLIDMHQYDKAASYFHMNLRNLPTPKHPDRLFIDEYLGELQMRVKNFNKAFEYFLSSYKEKQKVFSKDDPNMLITYNHLGNYYKSIGNLKTAEQYYKKTLNHEKNIINTAVTKLNLATIFVLKKKYSNAQEMCLEAREIFEQLHPVPYGDILACQGVLGDIYFQKHQYHVAESYYLVAFEMGKKYLSLGDPRLIHCIYALADLYHKQEKPNHALQFCREQKEIYEKYLSNTKHICIGQILLKMGDLSNRIDDYRKALDIFNHNARLDYLSTAKCLVKLSELNQNDEKSIQQALRIYRKIYPPKHGILIQMEEKLRTWRKTTESRKNLPEQNGFELAPLLAANQNDQEEEET